MPIADVQSYEQLQSIDDFAHLPEAQLPLGVFMTGSEKTGRAGFSFDFRGVRPYQPGDPVRDLNFPASARSDGYMTNEWDDEKSTHLLVVSDMLRHYYAETPGEQYASRALGMLAIHAMLRLGINERSPISTIWANGFESKEVSPMRHGTDTRGIQHIIKEGISMAADATQRITEYTQQKDKKSLFRKKTEKIEKPEEKQTLTNALDKATVLSRRLMRARVVVVSDFRSIDVNRSGKSWADTLELLGRQNQIITIEVTNPLLRGLISGHDDYQAGAEGLVLEDNQHETYAKLAHKRSGEIRDSLQKVSDKHVHLDTSEINWAESLAAQLKE